jgi:tRNA A37 threonylcarbamoyladenosine dehydratase
MHEGCESMSMILHYHPNFSTQKRRKDSNAKTIEVHLEARLSQGPSWRDSLRQPGIVSAATATVGLLIGGVIITIIVFHPHRCIVGIDRGG